MPSNTMPHVVIDERFLRQFGVPTMKVLADILDVRIPSGRNTAESISRAIRSAGDPVLTLCNAVVDRMSIGLARATLQRLRGAPKGGWSEMAGAAHRRMLRRKISGSPTRPEYPPAPESTAPQSTGSEESGERTLDLDHLKALIAETLDAFPDPEIARLIGLNTATCSS